MHSFVNLVTLFLYGLKYEHSNCIEKSFLYSASQQMLDKRKNKKNKKISLLTTPLFNFSKSIFFTKYRLYKAHNKILKCSQLHVYNYKICLWNLFLTATFLFVKWEPMSRSRIKRLARAKKLQYLWVMVSILKDSKKICSVHSFSKSWSEVGFVV